MIATKNCLREPDKKKEIFFDLIEKREKYLLILNDDPRGGSFLDVPVIKERLKELEVEINWRLNLIG